MSALDEIPRSGTVVVREARIVMATEGAARLTGRTLRELEGLPYENLFVPEDRERIVDRYRRRMRGEVVPNDYEATVLRSDGTRVVLELHVDLEGADVVVHYRDISLDMVRRANLQQLATLGAAIQRERTEADVLARLRSALPGLGLSPVLMRRDGDGVRVEWSQLPKAIEDAWVAVAGQPLTGMPGQWSGFGLKAWREGAAFTDDWGIEATGFAPEVLAGRGPQMAALFRVQRAVAVRLDERKGPRFYLTVGASWLRHEDVAAIRLFGAQVAAALDAANAIADLSRRLSDLSAVHNLTGRIFASPAGDVYTLLHDGCRAAAAALGCESGAAFLVEDEGKVLHAVGLLGAPPVPHFRFAIEKDQLAVEAIRTRAPVFSPDVTQDPRSAMCGQRVTAPAMLTVPLVSRSAVRGVLTFGFPAGREFSDAERSLAVALAGELAVGLENAELYAASREQVRNLSLLGEMSRTLTSSLDLDQVLHAGALAARRILDTDRAFLILHDAAGGTLRLAAGSGERAAELMERYRPSLELSGITARVLREGRILAIEDLATEPDAHPAHRSFDSKSVLAAPLLIRGEPLGVLFADSCRRRRFTAAEQDQASAVADQLAVAIDNARLYQETRRRAEELGLLHEVGRSLVASLDIEEVLQAGVRNLARIIEAPVAMLALAAPETGALEFRAIWGGPRELIGRPLPLDPVAIIGAGAFARREPLIIEDVSTDARIPEAQRSSFRGRAILALPLLVRDHFVGAAVIVETRDRRRFSGPEIERATAVANQLAVAVENARLYEDLRRSYEKLAQAQRQLIQKERLAALGELSAVVAHEVRNPLGVIFNSLGSLRRLLQPQGDARVLLDIVGEEADRLNRIVRDLLDFARPVTPVLRPEPLQGVVDEAVAAALAEGGSALVEVERDVGQELPPVPVDAHLVRQAVLNVAANAIQAMPRGGRLTVRIRRDPPGVLVELEDTGPGIPDEIRTRIFEPFFTTKASGTGLGLAVVKRIMDGHGGEISVATRPGGGTVVQLRFPVAFRVPGERAPA